MTIPFLACCSFIGTMLVKIMPSILTLIAIISILLIALYKSIVKWKQLRKIESETQSYNTSLHETKSDISNNEILTYLTISIFIVLIEICFSVGRKHVPMCSTQYILICVGQVIFINF
jgi:L-lactate permease